MIHVNVPTDFLFQLIVTLFVDVPIVMSGMYDTLENIKHAEVGKRDRV